MEPRIDKDARPLDNRVCGAEPLLHVSLDCAGPTRGGLVPLSAGLLGLAENLESYRPHACGLEEGTEAWRVPSELVSEPSQASGFSVILRSFYHDKLARYLHFSGLCEQGSQNAWVARDTPNYLLLCHRTREEIETRGNTMLIRCSGRGSDLLHTVPLSRPTWVTWPTLSCLSWVKLEGSVPWHSMAPDSYNAKDNSLCTVCFCFSKCFHKLSLIASSPQPS